MSEILLDLGSRLYSRILSTGYSKYYSFSLYFPPIMVLVWRLVGSR